MIKRTPIKRYKPLQRSQKPIPRNKPVVKQRSKEKKVKDNLSSLKKEIELTAVQNNEYYCKGCGKSYPGLDKSHILSVGRFKQLELVKENIQLMCRECHTIWESGTIEQKMKLNCFSDNLLFIKQYDVTEWLKLTNSISINK